MSNSTNNLALYAKDRKQLTTNQTVSNIFVESKIENNFFLQVYFSKVFELRVQLVVFYINKLVILL